MSAEVIKMRDERQDIQRPGWLKLCWVAARTFALPATVTPVVFGTAAAVTLGAASFSPPLFLTAVVAMALLHTGANLFNDAMDFRKGLDVLVTPGSGAVVRGWITPGQALRASLLLLAAGSALGLLLVWLVGVDLLWIGLAGVCLGVCYSVGPVWLKARALGDLAVMMAFGVLGALGAWTVQAGSASWPVALWAVPIGLHVAAILHANNWRDMGHDRAESVRTIAGVLGDQGSLVYYLLLVWLPYLLVSLFVLAGQLALLPALPPATLVVWVSAPEALRLSLRAAGRGSRDPREFLALDAASARLNMLFGLLYAAGLVALRLLG